MTRSAQHSSCYFFYLTDTEAATFNPKSTVTRATLTPAQTKRRLAVSAHNKRGKQRIECPSARDISRQH
jgi:hypothetical protein